MGEIKFRAWNQGNKKWLASDDIKILLDGKIEVFGNGPLSVSLLAQYYPLITIQQFTGLHDCAGKEIYEGDIIKFLSGRYEVVFEKGAFLYKSIRYPEACCGSFNSSVLQGMIIIGNVFENPKLLVKDA